MVENEAYVQLDKTICKLESLGTILTQLTTMESQDPDLSSLADLGRLISEQAMIALDLAHGFREDPPVVAVQEEPKAGTT